MQAKNQLEPSNKALHLMPEPLAPELDKPVPYPIDAMPPILRGATEAIIERVQVPDAIAAFSVLAAVNYLAQTRIDAQSPVVYAMPSTLWMLTLGNSGVRKSTAYKTALKPLLAGEQKNLEAYGALVKQQKKQLAGLSQKERKAYLIENPEPPTPQTIIASDGGYSRITSMFVNEGVAALSWNTDEGGEFFGGHSLKADNRAAVLGGMTKLKDAGEVQRIRSKENADGSGFGYGKRLSIFLLAQNITVRESLNDPLLRGQGFLPRFLFAAPDALDGTRFLTLEQILKNSNDDARLQLFWQRLIEIHKTSRALNIDYEDQIKAEPLPLNREARKLWLDAYNEIEATQGAGGEFCELSAFASRGGENIAILAANLAFFDGKASVDAEAMQAAITLCKHSLNEWLRYSHSSLISKTTSDAIKASDWLIKQIKDGKTQWLSFTANQWGKTAPRALRSAKARNLAFAELIEKHHLFYNAENKTYSINKLLFDDMAETAETAETPINQGAGDGGYTADNGGNTEIKNCSAKLPPPSAKLPPTKKPVNAELPPLPPNPPPFESESINDWRGEMTI